MKKIGLLLFGVSSLFGISSANAIDPMNLPKFQHFVKVDVNNTEDFAKFQAA